MHISNKRFPRIICSVILVISILSICSCNRIVEETEVPYTSETIAINAPTNRNSYIPSNNWYDPSIVHLSGEGEDFGSMTINQYLGSTESSIVISSESFVGGDYSLLFYSYEGAITRTIDLLQLIKLEFQQNANISICGVSMAGDKILAYFNNENSNYEVLSQHVVIVDANDGTILAIEDGSFNEEMCNRNFKMGEYDYFISNMNGVELVVSNSSGSSAHFNLSNDFSEYGVTRIDAVFPYDETSALIVCDCYEDELIPLVLDLENSCFIDEYVGMDLIYDVLANDSYSYVEGVGLLFSSYGAVYKADFKEGTKEEVFNFNQTNINWNTIQWYKVVSLENSRIVMVSSTWKSNDIGTWRDVDILILNINENNPNEDKTILKLASLSPEGAVSDSIAEAVVDFNNSSEDYHIIQDLRYAPISNYYNKVTLDSLIASQESLQEDIEEGIGPDIILNGSFNPVLHNENYLVDVKDIIPEGINEHIISLAMKGDSLYYLPISFSFEGLALPSSDALPMIPGFTYDEYATYASDNNNGESLFFANNKIDTFILQFASMNDIFYQNGAYDYSNEEFSNIASFTNNYIPEDTSSLLDEYDWRNYYLYGIDLFAGQSGYHKITCFPDLMEYSEMTFLGFPSTYRRGITISIEESIAVTASAISVEGAKEFITSLFTEDIQSMTTNFPVFDSVFEDRLQYYIDENNATYEELSSDPSYLESDYYKANFIDDSYVSEIMELINNSSSIYLIDPVVEFHIRMEMLDYYSGDYSLDEVIESIEIEINTN